MTLQCLHLFISPVNLVFLREQLVLQNTKT